MSNVAVTKDIRTFYDWAARFVEGSIETVPMLDELNQFSNFLPHIGARMIDFPEEANPETRDSVENHKYVFVRSESPYFNIKDLVGTVTRSRVVLVPHLSDIRLMARHLSAKYIMVLAAPEELNHDFYTHVYHSVMEYCPIALITGKTLSHLSWLLVKTCIYQPSNKSIVVLPRNDKTYTLQGGTEFITNADNMSRRLNQLLDGEQYGAFLVSTHGSEDVVSLQDSIICGKSHFYQAGNGLTCELGKSCPVKDNGVTTDQVNARIVVLNICMGTRFSDTLLPTDVSLSNSFLENYAAVYVSPSVIKYGPDAELCFLHTLLINGYSIGDAVRLLNLWLNQTDFDIPSFVITGDPETGYELDLHSSIESGFVLEWKSDAQFEVVFLSEQALGVIDLPESWKSENTFVDVNGSREVYYAIIGDPITNRTRLFTFSWTGYSQNRITITLLNRQKIENEINYANITNWIFGLQRYALGKKVHNEFPTVFNALDRLAVKVQELCYDATAYRRVTNDLEKLNKKMECIQNDILDSALHKTTSDTSIWMPDVYYEYSRLVKHRDVYYRCPFCNSRSSKWNVIHRVTHQLRVIHHCPKCGVIEDNPANPKVEIRFQLSDYFNTITEAVPHVTVTNLSAKIIKGAGGLRFESTRVFNLCILPDKFSFCLAANESTTFELKVETTKISQPYLYSAKILVLADLELYYTSCPIFVQGGVLSS